MKNFCAISFWHAQTFFFLTQIIDYFSFRRKAEEGKGSMLDIMTFDYSSVSQVAKVGSKKINVNWL